MRRLTRGRAATDDEAAPQASAASEPVGDAPHDAPQGGSGLPANGSVAAADEQRTTILVAGDEGRAGQPVTAAGSAGATPAGEPGATSAGETKVLEETRVGEPEGRDLPAGVDAATLAGAPTSARRGRLRRRLRYLNAVREVLLRDLGGFYYEAQRTEEGPEAHRRLLDAKAARIARLDDEARELEARLEQERTQTLIRQPGLGGTCPQCGDLHGSDARFCSRCGTPLGKAAAAPPRPPASAPTASGEPKATTASLWGRPKRPSPATADPTIAGPAATVASKPATVDDKPASAADKPATVGDEPASEHAATRGEDAEAASGEPAPTGSERS